MVHQPVSRGLAVFANAWLSGWLAEISADLRENGSALEVVPRRCAIQIYDFTLLNIEMNRPTLLTYLLTYLLPFVLRVHFLHNNVRIPIVP